MQVNYISIFINIINLFYLNQISLSQPINNAPNYFCSPTIDSVDNIIRDLIASQHNESTLEHIADYCERRNPNSKQSETIPDKVSIKRSENNWLVSFTYKSYPSVYSQKIPRKSIKADDLNENNKNNTSTQTWMLYLLTRRPFDCQFCRISIFLTSNLTKNPTEVEPGEPVNVTYGFLRTMFPSFIDYTRPATIFREDKSKYHWTEGNLTDFSGKSPANIYFDDSFFGHFEQYFLVGFSPKTTNSPDLFLPSSESFLSNSSLLTSSSFNTSESFEVTELGSQSLDEVTITLDLSEENTTDELKVTQSIRQNTDSPTNGEDETTSDYQQSFLSQSELQVILSEETDSLGLVGIANPEDNPALTYTICYAEDNNNKKFRASSLCYPYLNLGVAKCICWETTQWKTWFTIYIIAFLALSPLVYSLYRQSNPVEVITIEKFENPASPGICVYTTKILIRIGHLEAHKLPGHLDLDLKRANGTSLFQISIPRTQIWSSPKLLSNDVNDLIVRYKSTVPMERPRYVEVIFQKESAAANLIYFYGVQIDTNTYHQVYPYCHYLQNDRNVRLSDASEWSRALTRINMTTSLPITLQRVQSVTWIERSIICLFIFQLLSEKLIFSLEDYDYSPILAGIGEGLTVGTVYIWILIGYVLFFKRHNADRYNLMPISLNHQFYAIIGSLLIFMVAIETINTALLVNRIVWRDENFNHKIAENYSEINKNNDLAWIISVSIGFVLFLSFSFTVESLFFQIYKPNKAGPSAFDLGYDVNEQF